MNNIEYVKFDNVSPDDFVMLLNSVKVRKHLITHDLFTAVTIVEWMNSKMEINAIEGCKIRAMLSICFRGDVGVRFSGKWELWTIL